MDSIVVEHIEKTPGTCGGKPRIAGTRIRVVDVMIWHELQGLSADEIVSEYPHLSLADVHAALAYYHDNREEIRQQMKESDDFVNAMKASSGPGLLQKLTGHDVHGDSVPS